MPDEPSTSYNDESNENDYCEWISESNSVRVESFIYVLAAKQFI